MIFEVVTGAEWHTTEKRSGRCWVDGVFIYEKLKSIQNTWHLVGNKGKHGKWNVARYDIPIGSKVTFKATANRKEDRVLEFIVKKDMKDINFDGYEYSGEPSCWIISYKGDLE
jgi:hypothetical protein